MCPYAYAVVCVLIQYDSSDYKDPTAHAMQKAPDGAYAFRKVYHSVSYQIQSQYF
jgi:hypothetical protein